MSRKKFGKLLVAQRFERASDSFRNRKTGGCLLGNGHKKWLYLLFRKTQPLSLFFFYVNIYEKVSPRKHDLLALCKDAGLYSELKRSEWKPTLAKLSSLYIL
jgi:hypothetical protein